MCICYPTIYDMTMLALASQLKILVEWKYPVYPDSILKKLTYIFPNYISVIPIVLVVKKSPLCILEDMCIIESIYQGLLLLFLLFMHELLYTKYKKYICMCFKLSTFSDPLSTLQ
jgi:hypothetical protein